MNGVRRDTTQYDVIRRDETLRVLHSKSACRRIGTLNDRLDALRSQGAARRGCRATDAPRESITMCLDVFVLTASGAAY